MIRDLFASGPTSGSHFSHANIVRLSMALLLLLVFCGPLMTLSEGPLTGEGSFQRQIGYLVAFGLAVYGARPLADRAALLAVPWPIIAMLLWCWLSLLWALDPHVAIRRLFLMTLVVWTVFIIVNSAGYRATMQMVRIALGLALIANFLTVLLAPDIGIHHRLAGEAVTAVIGNWCGFMAHKNFAGAACALCILCFSLDAREIRPLLRLAVITGAVLFLYEAQSKTSAGVCVIALVAGFVFQRYDARYRSVLVPLLTVAVIVVSVLTSAYSSALQTDYLDPHAFTGRGQIWQALFRYASDHLMLGAGYGSFWNIGPTSPIYTYATGFVTKITVGHNGYLDLLVTVGLPGVLLAVFAAILWPIARLLLTRGVDPARGALVLSIILFCMGHNVTESSLFDRDAFVGVFLMLANALSLRTVRRGRRSSDVAGDHLMLALNARPRLRL